jgi:hypothetical protein
MRRQRRDRRSRRRNGRSARRRYRRGGCADFGGRYRLRVRDRRRDMRRDMRGRRRDMRGRRQWRGHACGLRARQRGRQAARNSRRRRQTASSKHAAGRRWARALGRRRWRHGAASHGRWWWTRSRELQRRVVVKRSFGRTRITIPSHRVLGISPMMGRRKSCVTFREHGSAFFQARKASAPHFEFYDGSIPSRQIWRCDRVTRKGLTSVLRALPHARDLRRQRFVCVPAWIEMGDRVRRARVCAPCGLRFTHLCGSLARELL